MPSQDIQESLRKRNIPYRIYGGLSFYQRKEIKDLLAYFRIIINPADSEALKRIINYPARGIGQATMTKLETLAAENESSIWSVISQLPGSNPALLSSGTINKLKNFLLQIVQFKRAIAGTECF